MYALKDYIGEQALNQALRAYVETVALQEAPYTTAMELLALIKEATPARFVSTVEDLFERITLYDNRVTEARWQPLGDGSYEVTLSLRATKLYADGLGVETEAPMRTLVDVGVFSQSQLDGSWEAAPLYLQKHWIQSGQNLLTLRVDGRPEYAGIDPYNKLIDRNPGDNVATVRRNNEGS